MTDSGTMPDVVGDVAHDVAEAGLTGAQAATDLAQAECGESISCFGAPLGYPDAMTCIARRTQAASDMMAAPGSSLTPTAAEACAKAVAMASCPDWYSGNVAACQWSPGHLGPGTPCAYGVQCASGFCNVAPDSTCGVCGPGLGAGVPCSSTAECTPPLACGPGGTCTMLAGAGSSCSMSVPCAYPLGCQGGVCTTAAVGSACDVTSQDCAAEEFCSSTSNTCQAFQWSPPGQLCGWVAGDMSIWRDCSIGSCQAALGSTTPTCSNVVIDGLPCSATSVCIPPAVCGASNTCTLPHAASCK